MKKSKDKNKVKEIEELEILESGDDSNFDEECEKMEEISLLENKSEEQIIAEIRYGTNFMEVCILIMELKLLKRMIQATLY